MNPDSMSLPRSTAPTQLENVLAQLRESVMRGRFAPGARLEEKHLAEQLGVSRTPVRLALQSLAQEGLLVYNPHRGFQVRAFTRQEVIDAIDVRGRLEAFACELLAARGVTGTQEATLEQNLADTRDLVAQRHHTPADVDRWAQLNESFHHVLLEGSGNGLVLSLIAQMRTIPMASAGIIPTTTSNVDDIMAYVRDALGMHTLVFDAVRKRQPARAHNLMQEHVYQGRERILMQLDTRAQQTDEASPWHRISDAVPKDPPPRERRLRAVPGKSDA